MIPNLQVFVVSKKVVFVMKKVSKNRSDNFFSCTFTNKYRKMGIYV